MFVSVEGLLQSTRKNKFDEVSKLLGLFEEISSLLRIQTETKTVDQAKTDEKLPF